MIALTVLYPQTADSHFDLAYYLDKHIPLVKERLMPMGLTSVIMQEGMAGGTPDSPPTYAMMTSLVFGSTEEMNTGMGIHGSELLGDIPNFTDAQPFTQVCQMH